VTKPPAHP